MKVRLGTLRRFFRETLQEQAWVPTRWMPGEGEPVDDDDLSRLSSPDGLGMDETDARMVGDDAGPGDHDEDDISDHLRGDQEKHSLGDAPDETMREASSLNREIKRFMLQESPPGAGMSDPVGAAGAYSSFDMTKDHTGTDDLSSTWYRSPGRPAGTEGDPFRSEDPHAQLGFHPPAGPKDPVASPPGPDGEEGTAARLAPPIWQLTAGSDTSKVLGANAKPDTGEVGSGDEPEEGEEGSESEDPGTEPEQGSGAPTGGPAKGQKQDPRDSRSR